MIDLRKIANGRYRIVAEETAEIPNQTSEDRQWLRQIPGRFGHIGVWSKGTLCGYCHGPRVARRLVELPFVRVRQQGDTEATVEFDPDHLDDVAGILGCYRRRRLSDDGRRKLVAAGAGHRFAGVLAARG